MVYVVRKRCLFRAGERLFGLRGLTGLNRPQFSEVVGMDPKRLENIESGRQRMHDEDFEKVCGTFPEFSDWIAYEGSIEPQSIAWKIAEAAQEAAVYLVERNPRAARTPRSRRADLAREASGNPQEAAQAGVVATT
ncbi:Uncharacterised protein [Pseudomonas aeruginosa]|nr:Uncharacterised protein [Pseudomonas aeruginosa]